MIDPHPPPVTEQECPVHHGYEEQKQHQWSVPDKDGYQYCEKCGFRRRVQLA